MAGVRVPCFAETSIFVSSGSALAATDNGVDEAAEVMNGAIVIAPASRGTLAARRHSDLAFNTSTAALIMRYSVLAATRQVATAYYIVNTRGMVALLMAGMGRKLPLADGLLTAILRLADGCDNLTSNGKQT